MSDGAQVEEAIAFLLTSKASIRCQEMATLLQGLGFVVRDGKKQGHKVIVHDGLQGFLSDSYTCGHGRNPEIKPAYVGKLARLLRRYKAELVEYLEG